MALELRWAAFLDDPIMQLEDAPDHSPLRIPPLQGPVRPRSSSRPSPLEPSAGVNGNVYAGTAKLTSRRKALAEARPIGEPDPEELPTTRTSSQEHVQKYYHRQGDDQLGPSLLKRRRLLHHAENLIDFVQLPKPPTKAKQDKPPPFQPISVLNELHEPPPSAALFPPITPSASQDAFDSIRGSETTVQTLGGEVSSTKGRSNEAGGRDNAKKRVALRPRQRWTEHETRQLMEGVEIYGAGKWKKILQHSEFTFQPGRTAVDLKDRFRTIFPEDFRARLNTTSSDTRSSPTQNESQRPRSPNARSIENQMKTIDSASTINPMSNDVEITSTLQLTKPLEKSPTENDTVRLKRRPKRAWTEREDADLATGYQKHGYQWTAISKDTTLNLAHRTGPQVRDRFRLKYPELYTNAGVMPKETVEPKRESARERPAVNSRNSGKVEEENLVEDEADDEGRDLDRSRRSSLAGGTRNLAIASGGIFGLLNDEVEDERPSFHDDWGDNTLPPLLWEDMATRPMFDLE